MKELSRIYMNSCQLNDCDKFFQHQLTIDQIPFNNSLRNNNKGTQ